MFGVVVPFDPDTGEPKAEDYQAFLGGKMIRPHWRNPENTRISALISLRYVEVGQMRLNEVVSKIESAETNRVKRAIDVFRSGLHLRMGLSHLIERRDFAFHCQAMAVWLLEPQVFCRFSDFKTHNSTSMYGSCCLSGVLDRKAAVITASSPLVTSVGLSVTK